MRQLFPLFLSFKFPAKSTVLTKPLGQGCDGKTKAIACVRFTTNYF